MKLSMSIETSPFITRGEPEIDPLKVGDSRHHMVQGAILNICSSYDVEGIRTGSVVDLQARASVLCRHQAVVYIYVLVRVARAS
jgi:hypothetical protein